VRQEFYLLPFLTTKETLYIAARLKLETDRSKQAVYAIVSDIFRVYYTNKISYRADNPFILMSFLIIIEMIKAITRSITFD